ncbi:50S ribosomal protein L5 [symbiont of Argiope bruennichi]|uniref:50S ribosomal protein L5 n=1 Tax=symbiont of Argiope bruennichi TaxID=2810479 RepID=UPI003DA601FE
MNNKEKYNVILRKKLLESKEFSNIMEVPKVTKIVVNVGMGKYLKDKNYFSQVVQDLATIFGQRPVITKAKKSVSNFKLRKGMDVGIKLTLRNKIMFDNLDKLINIIFPRIRDFDGFNKKSFNKFGNFSFGIKEHIVFPEIDFAKIDRIFGMDITIVTSSSSISDTLKLFKVYNFPIKE